jgi:hypothetical protein
MTFVIPLVHLKLSAFSRIMDRKKKRRNHTMARRFLFLRKLLS